MSLENIKKKVKAKLKTENKKFATTYFNKNLQGTKLVEIIWGTDALIDGCKIGATEVLDRLLAGKIIDSQTHASYMSHNISNNWVRYAKQISKTAKQNRSIGGVGFTKYTKGMVMNTPYPMYQANFSDMKIKRPKTWSLLLLIPGAQNNAERTLKILYDNLVQELWIAFVNDIATVFGPNAILPTTSIPPRKGKKNKRSVLNVLKQSGLKKEHSRPTTRALQAIQSLKTTTLGFNAGLKLKEHDLAFLAENKPGLVEKVIDKGSKDMLRCLEIVSGSPLTEEELNVTKKSKANTQCPDIANPNYIPN